MNDQSMPILCDILKQVSIVSLLLPNNQISTSGARLLSEALKIGSHSLTTLILDNNQLKDDGLTALATAFEVNPQLSELSLVGNAIGDTGIGALIEGLNNSATKNGKPHTFISFNLAYNLIGDAGCAAIANFVSTNASVTNVNLDHNVVGDAGMAALTKAMLSPSFKVENLSLAFNQLSVKSLNSLPESILALTVPLSLDVSDNPLLTRYAVATFLAADSPVSVDKFKIKRKFEDPTKAKTPRPSMSPPLSPLSISVSGLLPISLGRPSPRNSPRGQVRTLGEIKEDGGEKEQKDPDAPVVKASPHHLGGDPQRAQMANMMKQAAQKKDKDSES
jgi:Ran GTPase-activating protein (RanGAP) involved in mRNA processing and transport